MKGESLSQTWSEAGAATKVLALQSTHDRHKFDIHQRECPLLSCAATYWLKQVLRAALQSNLSGLANAPPKIP